MGRSLADKPFISRIVPLKWKSVSVCSKLVGMSEQQQTAGSTLAREQILAALGALSDELGKKGIIGEICLFGGTVMVLAFRARLSTKDVDALFQPTPLIREAARRI